MKKIASLSFLFVALLFSACSNAQDKSKRPSPPAVVKQTLANGTIISIDYSQPSVKGRTIGKDIEPKEGEVWRTGANEATVFEVSNAVKINGKDLAAGKYGLFSISGKDTWTIIFNKTWKQWGASSYKQDQDAIRIDAVVTQETIFAEKMTFTITDKGVVNLFWGNNKATFMVE